MAEFRSELSALLRKIPLERLSTADCSLFSVMLYHDIDNELYSAAQSVLDEVPENEKPEALAQFIDNQIKLRNRSTAGMLLCGWSLTIIEVILSELLLFFGIGTTSKCTTTSTKRENEQDNRLHVITHSEQSQYSHAPSQKQDMELESTQDQRNEQQTSTINRRKPFNNELEKDKLL